MTRSCLILAAFLLLVAAPGHAFASTLTTGRTLVISEPPVDNAYLAGTDVTVVAPLPADLLAAGGTLSVSGPVAGDAMLAGGTVNIRKPIAGDARIVAGQLSIDAPIAGDFIAAAGSITRLYHREGYAAGRWYGAAHGRGRPGHYLRRGCLSGGRLQGRRDGGRHRLAARGEYAHRRHA